MTAAGVVALEEMVDLRLVARNEGRVVVFTNGCFDILHMGHVSYLRDACRLGDVLFVGVNSDASARGLKGSGRPVNSQDARAGVVAALADVDAVTIFDEKAATSLVSRLEPDIYVKGGDYSLDPRSPRYPPEAAVVVEHGGIFRTIPLLPGYSTSALIQRLVAAAPNGSGVPGRE